MISFTQVQKYYAKTGIIEEPGHSEETTLLHLLGKVKTFLVCLIPRKSESVKPFNIFDRSW